ncbi:MAG: cyclase family protein [Halobacteriovoraceae bacterium]|nr:cyclase family protein [Halobacteriovoraceae bacterium]
MLLLVEFSVNLAPLKMMIKDLNNTIYHDITPEISKDIAVFPGDTPFKRSVLKDCKAGDAYTLSSIETTVHIGAHTDASNHYHKEGVGISQHSLEYYLGPCQVIEVDIPRGERIKPQDIKEDISAPRVLFKTNSYPVPNKWNEDFNSLSSELVDFLAHKKVIMVGIDTPSIDPSSAKELVSHLAIFKNKMAILEGIVLDKVLSGVYFLIALPLKIKDADASPVRAILLEQS